MLIKEFRADVNVRHDTLGTPLHCAVREGRRKIVSLLITVKAKIDINTEEKENIIKLSNDEVITRLLKEYEKHLIQKEIKRTKHEMEELKGLQVKHGKVSSKWFIPPRPPMVKGHIYKLGSLLSSKHLRYFVLDPFNSTLAKYKKKGNYPHKLAAVYSLRSIKELKMTHSEREFCYFEFFCERRHRFCCKGKAAASLWVKYLNCAIVFATFLNDVHCNINALDASKRVRQLNRKLLEKIEDENQEEINIDDEPDHNPLPLQLDLEEEKPPCETLQPTEQITLKSFKIICKIGIGAFGSIYKVVHTNTGKIYAMKTISKRYLAKTKQMKYALSESKLLRIVDHPFVIKMYYAFQTPEHIHFVLDYCELSDLSGHIDERQIFTEKEARFYISELILAIEYLHSKDIVYRDLKPANILICTPALTLGGNGHIKLSDFGLAKQILGQEPPRSLSFCGSLSYLSPDMLTNKSSHRTIDVYGIGTILYELLSGLPPFYTENPKALINNIKHAKLKIPQYLSTKARSVLKALLDRNPSTRITLPELKQHPFFEKINWDDVYHKKIVPPISNVNGSYIKNTKLNGSAVTG
eukprot:TRINITY_DN1585_c0_g1_i2.p1 TRINITY_DN1585_c0_g1~~TRINITY_DN1585_c0_g1_i2.p1  ORF type:complete len:582 (+),score=143.91 TRINITY_DN1585_c0_g1_i2:687-2432(+)